VSLFDFQLAQRRKANHLFAKLFVTVLAVGATGCGLLALRQQRLDAVHQQAMTQRRIMAADRDINSLRWRLSSEVTPQRVEVAAAKIGSLVPLGLERPGVLTIQQPAVADAQGTNPERQEELGGLGAFGGGVNRRP
jgi:hypothetical protein